jgi:small-conductance mechanosensitive channel
MNDTYIDIGWAIVFSLVGGIIGILLILAATLFIPRILSRLTPNLNEDKEIARGNRAVAEYFGRVVGATIIAIGVVIAASILGGIIAALF